MATLGTKTTEAKFRTLSREWALGTQDNRQALDVQLRNFCRQYQGDPLVRYAHVLRAWNALERDELELAHELAQDAALGPAGVPRDLATLILGAIERRRGDHPAALERLEKLQHKMLDDFATMLLDEELVRSALGMRQWERAVQFMQVWFRESGAGGRREASERMAVLLSDVPTDDLLDAIAFRSRLPDGDAGYVLAELIAGHVAARALNDGDASLAKRLISNFGPLLGDRGEEVARLAAAVTRGRVLARTVGLLVALRGPEVVRRSADVVTGMAHGLGVPGSGARLVTRFATVEGGVETEASIRTALAALAADGAAVIVAGIDPRHSPMAAQFASNQSLPVILLTSVADFDKRSSPYVFQLGEDPAHTAGALSAALRDGGAQVIAGLGGPQRPGGADDSLGVGLERSCLPLPSAQELTAERVDALVVYDGAACDKKTVELARQIGAPLAIGLGVRQLGREVLPHTLRLGSGVFPVLEVPDPRLEDWLAGGRDAPSWWLALGRDAAVLAWDAVENLKKIATEESEVVASRVEATARLATARQRLWTTEARGFDDSKRVRRHIVVLK